jgi:hypothetical protein
MVESCFMCLHEKHVIQLTSSKGAPYCDCNVFVHRNCAEEYRRGFGDFCPVCKSKGLPFQVREPSATIKYFEQIFLVLLELFIFQANHISIASILFTECLVAIWLHRTRHRNTFAECIVGWIMMRIMFTFIDPLGLPWYLQTLKIVMVDVFSKHWNERGAFDPEQFLRL